MLPPRQFSPLPSLVAYQRAPSLTASVRSRIWRWFVRVLARLAIAATCTSSAAALDAQVEHGKCFLWENLTLNSSESVNSLARRYNVASRELPFDLRDNSRTTPEAGRGVLP